MAIKTFPAKLVWHKMLSPKVKHLAFKREDGEKLNYIPGQFISVHFEHEDKPLRRSYSIATVDQTSDLIEFAISYVPNGPASELLMNLEVGQTLNFSGAYGRLILRDEPLQRLFLMATGTGVTPYRCMLPTLAQHLQANPALKIILILGVQYRQDALYADEFIDFAKKYPNFEFRTYFSRDELPGRLPHEYQGYAQHAFDALLMNPETDTVYLCGNPNMIDDAFNQLKENGFAIQQVRREKYVS
ncbi:MAG: ferredoxin--NADP(+) reductase [Legionellales bacterium]|nr:ferredoxin--NADP(+) reductase [Legionellales bacterium]